VLAFWFGDPPADEAGLMKKIVRWFRGGSEMDAEVRARFGESVEAALAGDLDGWADAPRSRLALILVLDQFTRNVFRGDARTYAGDAEAQRLALDAIDRGLDEGLSTVERLFLCMPLLHSEDGAMHERLAAYARRVAGDAPPLFAKMCAMHTEPATKYQEVIARFGRFPHRNAILGRPSTPEETRFLEDWDKRAHPAGMPA